MLALVLASVVKTRFKNAAQVNDHKKKQELTVKLCSEPRMRFLRVLTKLEGLGYPTFIKNP